MSQAADSHEPFAPSRICPECGVGGDGSLCTHFDLSGTRRVATVPVVNSTRRPLSPYEAEQTRRAFVERGRPHREGGLS